MFRLALKAVVPALLLPATSAALDIEVKLNKGDPAKLDQAVVYAVPENPATPADTDTSANIVQRDLQFEPYISVIQRNTAVIFPNRDDISHHVYSFSPAKSFELPLYKKQTPDPVLFDKAGLVVLGCNIHDWMLAYLLVVDTPYFTQMKNGNARLPELPKGKYRLHVWHPRLDKRDLTPLEIVVDDQPASITFALKYPLKANFRPKPPAQSFDDNSEY